MLCKKELGFGVPIYCYATRMGHADAMDEAYELAVERLLEGLADMTAKLYIEGKLLELEPAPGTGIPIAELAPEKPRKRRRRRRKLSKQYLLPEFDFHAAIPAGRGSQTPLYSG